MKKLWTYILTYTAICLETVSLAFAEQTDATKYFQVDLDAPLPDLQALAKEYEKETEIYNPRYILSWDIGSKFDPLWVNTISYYGLSEKRLKNPNEDAMVDMIKSLPKEFYPYIGPQLHSAFGISEKILNMPGIKETKNRFPERIAPQLADIEDLEFLSPHMYLLLMPEIWPSNQKPVEIPRQKPAKLPKITPPLPFYRSVMQNVPDNGYGGAARAKSAPDKNDLRTLKISASSPLTGGDIQAFLNTLPNVKAFGSLSNLVKIHRAEILLNFWEKKNGDISPLADYKDSVNPCARLALKIKWAGLETKFRTAVAPQGFDLKEWAYTCDKTIKAHRIANISNAMLITLKNYKNGVYDKYFMPLKPQYRDTQFAVMAATLEMYKAPKADVMQALQNGAKIDEALRPLGGILLLSPINN